MNKKIFTAAVIITIVIIVGIVARTRNSEKEETYTSPVTVYEPNMSDADEEDISEAIDNDMSDNTDSVTNSPTPSPDISHGFIIRDLENITYMYGCPDDMQKDKDKIAGTLREMLNGNYPLWGDPFAIYILPYGNNYMAEVAYEGGDNLFYIIYYNYKIGSYRCTYIDYNANEFHDQLVETEGFAYE